MQWTCRSLCTKDKPPLKSLVRAVHQSRAPSSHFLCKQRWVDEEAAVGSPCHCSAFQERKTHKKEEMKSRCFTVLSSQLEMEQTALKNSNNSNTQDKLCCCFRKLLKEEIRCTASLADGIIQLHSPVSPSAQLRRRSDVIVELL